MYDSKNENQASFNDDDYQYYNRKPILKIILISLGVLILAAAAYYFFIQRPKTHEEEISNFYDTTSVSKPKPAVITETVTPVTSPAVNSAAGNKFHIIAGAFVVEKNASAYMEELQKKGYNPQIILKKNEYSFISLFSYPTFKEANAKYKELENQGFPIWIMKYQM